MELSRLARFINSNEGPIVSLTSAPYPSYFRRYFWHSTAILHKDILFRNDFKFLVTCGGGWSKDKLESQIKAITEAIERWAYFYFLSNSPKDAGLDRDWSTTGFAALPWFFREEEVLLNSYAEAVERWILGYLWNKEVIEFQRVVLDDKKIKKIFSFFEGDIYCYKTRVLSDKNVYDGDLSFYISLFRLKNGGVVVGSGCGIDENSFIDMFLNFLYIVLPIEE